MLITLQGRCDGVGQLEVSADSGADPSAVQGTSTFVRPERTAGLRQHTQRVDKHKRKEENQSLMTWCDVQKHMK